MELRVKNNSIYLKPFSLEWVNYHWITAWLTVFGALVLYYYLKGRVQGSTNWNWRTSSLLKSNAGEIRWNVIYNPWYNGSGGIFTCNRQGRRIAKEIKSLVKGQIA